MKAARILVIVILIISVIILSFIVYLKYFTPLKDVDLAKFERIEKSRKIIDTAIDSENLKLSKMKAPDYACNIKSDKLLFKYKDNNKNLTLYYSLYGFNPLSNDCWFTLGEICSNTIPDSGINKMFIYFIDAISIDTIDGNIDLKKGNLDKKIIAKFTSNSVGSNTELRPDPYSYGFYKKPPNNPNYIPRQNY